MIPVILFGLFGAHGFGVGLMIYLAAAYALNRALEYREDRQYEASPWGQARRAA